VTASIPGAILDDPELGTLIDFSQPVALLLVAKNATSPIVFRPRQEITRLFDGFKLTDPWITVPGSGGPSTGQGPTDRLAPHRRHPLEQRPLPDDPGRAHAWAAGDARSVAVWAGSVIARSAHDGRGVAARRRSTAS
jgi:hypothetical protein